MIWISHRIAEDGNASDDRTIAHTYRETDRQIDTACEEEEAGRHESEKPITEAKESRENKRWNMGWNLSLPL